MSNGASTSERKGLHPLAWVGIGCAGIVMLVVIALIIGSFFLARAVKDVAEDFEDNPGLAAARLVVKASPELEEVEVDEAAGTMTIRNTRTGELITVNLEDVEQGKLSWTGSDGEAVTVDVSQADEGTVRIESSDGEGFQLSTGAAVSDERPDWVPIYPGTDPEGLGTMTTDDAVHGSFTMKTADSVTEVRDYFSKVLKDAGFEVNVNTFSGSGQEGAMVNANQGPKDRNVVVIISREGDTTEMGLTYTEGK